MRPEAADYLGKARQCPDEAKQIAGQLPLQAYEYKSIADYAAGPATLSIGAADASSAVGTASRFIDCIAELLNQSPV